MPVLTFLQDAFDYTKGPYYRFIGRHTRKFCSRAAGQAKTDLQKRIWFVTAISADETLATMTGLEKRRAIGALADWKVQPKARIKHYTKALRLYLSALLVLYSALKGELLQKMGLTEPEFMRQWQWIFYYQKDDKEIFDRLLVPAFEQDGVDGLVLRTGELLKELLFPEAPLVRKNGNSLPTFSWMMWRP